MVGLESLKGTVFLCILNTEELPTVSASGTIAKSAEIIWCFLPWAVCSPLIPISLLRLQLDVQAGFRKGRGTRDEIANICWVIKKAREFQKNIYFCFIDYVKVLTVWITINCRKFWKIWEYQTTWLASWEICMQVRKQQLELDMEQQTGSK